MSVRGAQHRGFHVRPFAIFRRFRAIVLLAGLPTSPASSNPFDFLFDAPPEQATAPARAEEQCVPRPDTAATDGQRWVYRRDGHRKCWFQIAKDVVTAKKQARPRGTRRPVAGPENEAAVPKRKEVVDARAELLRSTPVETVQPTPPAPEFKVVDAAALPGTGAAAIVPPPVVPEPETNQLTPNHPTPSHVDVDLLLAAAPAASDAVVEPSSNLSSVPAAETGSDWQGWTSTLLGVLLMGLGLAFLLISSRTLWALSPSMRKNSPSSPARDSIVDETALQDPIAFLNVLAKTSPKKVERRYIASRPPVVWRGKS